MNNHAIKIGGIQMTTKKTEKVKERKEAKRTDDNVVYVGQKPTMSYVLAVITQFTGGLKEVHLNIDIGTEEREVEEGNKINVSTVDINLVK